MANPNIHSWEPEWQSAQPVNDALSMSVLNAIEWALCHKFRLIVRPKNISVVFREIPDEYDSADSDEMHTVYGMAIGGHAPAEGMSPSEVEIHININQTAEHACHTALHEMAHAKQMFEKRLYVSRIGDGIAGQLCMWNGRAFSTRLIPYINWPWEVEAEALAKEWRVEFLEYAAKAARELAAKKEAEAKAAEAEVVQDLVEA